MPLVSFDALPDSSRVWIFGSDRALDEESAHVLLRRVDEYLSEWSAHGAPLTVGREWRDHRFLAVAVDQSSAGASGCSIDGLFRVLQRVQDDVRANLVGGGRIFYRDRQGAVQAAQRAEIERLAASGAISRDTVVFDTSLTDLGTYRACFERPARESWLRELVPR